MEDTVFLLYFKKSSFSELKKNKAEHLLFTDAQLCCTHFEGVLFLQQPFSFLSGSGAELLLSQLRCAQRGRTVLFSSSFLIDHAPSQPQAVPSTAPPRISVGKWTQRYIRENAISTASGSAAIAHRFFPASQRAVTDAKDAAVCPEGKEKSSGRGIRSSTSVRTSQGRMRPTVGLRRILQRLSLIHISEPTRPY